MPDTTTPLSPAELRRYARHLSIPEFGMEGQRKLRAARVLCIGAGGLGSPIAMYLAAAGVGAIGIVDADVVDESNLQRQLLHGTADVGRSKLDSARDRLHGINPHVSIEPHAVRFTSENAMDIVRSYDVVIDGTDNFPTRYLSNDVCVFLKKPNIYGSILRFEGQCSVFAPHLGGPCYRCLLPKMPPPGSVPSCQEAGVLGVLPGIIGSVQAMETLKLILGIGTVPLGKLTCYDALNSAFRSIKLNRDPQCRLCGDTPDITSVSNTETTASASCDFTPDHMESITTAELRTLLNGNYEGLLLDVREPDEYAIASIEGARLIPLQTLPEHVDSLPKDREILIHCKSGRRSARAVEFLLENGFTKVKNVTGGIDSWLAEN